MLIKILLYVVLPYLICYLIASRVTRRYSLQNVSARSAGFGGFFMSSSEVLGGRFFATLGLALVFYGILALIYFAVTPTPAEEEKSEEEIEIVAVEDLPDVDYTKWAGLTYRAVFYTPNLKAIVNIDKRLPASDAKPTDGNYQRATEAFAKGDLDTAYANALASAERAYTFDALNLAANAGRRLGKNPEVAVLALAAADLAPESPYPWVHLAFVALAEEKDDLCEVCCVRAASLGQRDAWVIDQVKELRGKLAERKAKASESVTLETPTEAP